MRDAVSEGRRGTEEVGKYRKILGWYATFMFGTFMVSHVFCPIALPTGEELACTVPVDVGR